MPQTFLVAGHEVNLLNSCLGVIKINVDWKVTPEPSECHQNDFKKKANWVIAYLIREGLIEDPTKALINLHVICQTKQTK